MSFTVYELKPRFQALLRPATRGLAGAGVTANQVTLAALAGSFFVGFWLFVSGGSPAALLAVPAWLLVRMALNAVDGMLAREHGMKTKLGAVLNELGDVLSDVFLYFPLALVYRPADLAALAFTFGAALTEFCGVLSQALGGERRYDGPMGKSDRAVLVGAMTLLAAVLPDTLRLWPLVLTLATALAAWTCVKRCRGALGAR